MPSHCLLRINSKLLGMTLTIFHGVALARGPWPHYIPAPHNLIPGHSSPHHWAFAPAAPLPRRSCAHSLQPPALCLPCGLPNGHLFGPDLLCIWFIFVALPLNLAVWDPGLDLRVSFSTSVKCALSCSFHGAVVRNKCWLGSRTLNLSPERGTSSSHNQ